MKQRTCTEYLPGEARITDLLLEREEEHIEQPLFSPRDYRIVKKYVRRLNPVIQEVIDLRFREGLGWTWIARYLGVDPESLERRMGFVFSALKQACLQDAEFSRNKRRQSDPVLTAA